MTRPSRSRASRAFGLASVVVGMAIAPLGACGDSAKVPEATPTTVDVQWPDAGSLLKSKPKAEPAPSAGPKKDGTPSSR